MLSFVIVLKEGKGWEGGGLCEVRLGSVQAVLAYCSSSCSETWWWLCRRGRGLGRVRCGAVHDDGEGVAVASLRIVQVGQV